MSKYDKLIERLERKIVVDGCEMPGNDALHREAAQALRELQERSGNLKEVGIRLSTRIEELESRLRDKQNALDHAIDYGKRMDRRSEELERVCRIALKDQQGWPNRMREALAEDGDER